MSESPIHVLLIEDNPGDAQLFRVMLAEKGAAFSPEHVDRLSLGVERLKRGGIDIVLLDLSLPDSQGKSTFLKIRDAFPDLPIVLLTGLNDQELGVVAMREGIQDYLVKGQIDADALARSIRYSIERKRSALLLYQAQKAMTTSAKMAALGTMAGGVAHEINSPLGAISLMATAVEEELERPQQNRKLINKALSDIELMVTRIASITRGLRTFARDAQTDPLVSTSIKAIIDDTLVFCAYRFKDRQIQITQKVPKTLSIDCRSPQISQVLLNLLNNSFDAVKNLPEKWVEIEAINRNGFTEIAVTDSGPGIPKDKVDQLFDPFFTTKEPGEGTGLGLSISRSLVAGHQGHIYVDDSCPNTRFVVRFPSESRD